MSEDNHTLCQLLELPPLVAATMPYVEFLLGLKEHPEWADTAAALFVRAVREKGEVSLEEISPERRPYFEMLRSLKIPAWRAFAHVRGSQRVVARVMKHYDAAAQNGYQLRQMLTLFGGPACGKSFFVDGMVAVLEGQIVYSVKGCPVHENPVNLLKLLSADQLASLAEALGMGEKLHDLMKSALQPCSTCFQQVMGHGDQNTDNKPNLAKLEVVALRLSSRNHGISTWSPSAPGQGCSLLSALQQGSRGITRMQEAFSADGTEPGAVSELQVLFEATEGRRVPAGSCGKITGHIPHDGLIIAETNEGSWNRFLDNEPDPDAFTRRTRIITLPYNTVRCEEERAYRDFLAQLKAVPEIGPLALTAAATLAVASRMDQASGVDLITKIRLYDGEPLTVPKTFSRLERSDRGGALSGGLYPTSSKATSAESDSKNVTVEDLWDFAGEEEGKHGLHMGFMLSCVSQMCELALSHPRHKCLTALGVISYLRAKVNQHLMTPGLTEAEAEVLKRCKEYLKEVRSLSDQPGLVEKEYRRLLRNQLLQVFAPDYARRCAEDFARYRLHAGMFARGMKTFMDPTLKHEVRVDEPFLDDIDKWRGSTSSSEREQFRGSVDAQINHIIRSHAHSEGEGAVGEIEITWEIIPELAKAIRARLDDEIAKRVERLLTAAKADLNEDEAEASERAMAAFADLGYSEDCLKQALNYAKDHQLWKQS